MAKRPVEFEVELEYRFDRLLAEKLAQAYQSCWRLTSGNLSANRIPRRR